MTTTEYTEYTETVRNGVDTATMFATLDAIKAQPEIAEVPVPGHEPMARRRPQPVDDQGLLRGLR